MASNSSTSIDKGKELSPKKRSVIVKTPLERVADVIYWLMRTAVVVNIVALFFPAFNPARLSGMINKNMSLFSCGVSYDNIVSTFGRAFRQGWVEEPTFHMLNACSAVIILAVVIAAAGGCMSLGNRKMKKMGLVFSLIGGAIEIGTFFWLRNLYVSIATTAKLVDKWDRVMPMYPAANWLYLVLAIIFIVSAVLNFILIPSASKDDKFEMEPRYQLFLMMLPVIALAFVFSYLPLYGWRYAFYDYESGGDLTSENFVGFRWFTSLLQNSATKRDMVNVIKNTFAMSGLGIATSWLPMAFAIFLSEIKNMRVRRFIQTFTTIPNFISWVLVYALAMAIFSTDGFINTMLNNATGIAHNTNYLMDNSHMWLKMLAWGTWKGVGWSAIIYIAAISGIDQGLYEAATVDGAGRFAKMWYVTVPELIPTYCVLLLMSIANILTNGMEQYLVFSNAINRETMQVLDLYVYNLGIGNGQIPLSTVIGMVKSVISVTLLFAANGVSKAIRGESIV